jgi:hypothetical protein
MTCGDTRAHYAADLAARGQATPWPPPPQRPLLVRLPTQAQCSGLSPCRGSFGRAGGWCPRSGRWASFPSCPHPERKGHWAEQVWALGSRRYRSSRAHHRHGPERHCCRPRWSTHIGTGRWSAK